MKSRFNVSAPLQQAQLLSRQLQWENKKVKESQIHGLLAEEKRAQA